MKSIPKFFPLFILFCLFALVCLCGCRAVDFLRYVWSFFKSVFFEDATVNNGVH